METSGNLAGAVLDGTTVKRGLIIQVPATGTLDKIVFRTGSFATPQTLRISVQTVGADMLPTGSYYGSSAQQTQASPAANTTYTITLGTPATGATRGDFVAVVIEWDGTTGTGQIFGSNGTTTQLPGGVSHNGSAWALNSTLIPLITVGYGSTYYDVGRSLITAVTGGAFNSSSTGTVPSGDERGNKFICATPMRAVGIWIQGGSTAAGANYDVVLYSNGGSVLASLSVDGDIAASASWRHHYFATPYEMTAATYYVALKPTTTNNCTIQYDTVILQETMPGGTAWSMATRVDAGAWSESTGFLARIGLIVDQLEVGGGGGSVAMPVSGRICG
jgi:hypothetical protein